MKKINWLLIPTIAVFLTACNSSSPSRPTPTPQPNFPAQTTTSGKFSCQDNAKLSVDYLPNVDAANMFLTVPALNLIEQSMSLMLAPSASGVRYIHNVNPSVQYEWQAKGNIGVFSAKYSNGKVYQINCQKL